MGKILRGFLTEGLPPFWGIDSCQTYLVLCVATVQDYQGIAVDDPDNLSL